MEKWQLDIIVALFSTFFGLIALAISGFVGYLWGRRRAPERDLFMLWRNAFDRAAFRGRYKYHSDTATFRRAISTTIKTIAMGKLFDSDGQELAHIEGVYFGPSQIRNPKRRQTITDVRNSLQKIIKLSHFVDNPQKRETIIVQIDKERDTVIALMNDAWEGLGIETMPLPTAVTDPEDIVVLVQELQE